MGCTYDETRKQNSVLYPKLSPNHFFLSLVPAKMLRSIQLIQLGYIFTIIQPRRGLGHYCFCTRFHRALLFFNPFRKASFLGVLHFMCFALFIHFLYLPKENESKERAALHLSRCLRDALYSSKQSGAAELVMPEA